MITGTAGVDLELRRLHGARIAVADRLDLILQSARIVRFRRQHEATADQSDHARRGVAAAGFHRK